MEDLEKTYGFKLFPWQKDIIEKIMNNENFFISLPRRQGMNFIRKLAKDHFESIRKSTEVDYK